MFSYCLDDRTREIRKALTRIVPEPALIVQNFSKIEAQAIGSTSRRVNIRRESTTRACGGCGIRLNGRWSGGPITVTMNQTCIIPFLHGRQLLEDFTAAERNFGETSSRRFTELKYS